MKISIQRSQERGVGEHGWLHTKHSFSFANYNNPRRVGFGKLKVINEDVIEGGHEFGMHPHTNMEVVTIILEGELEHKDDAGNISGISANSIQRMSVGSGIMHSEYNASKTNPVHLLQIWVEPREKDIPPNYEQKEIEQDRMKNKLLTVLSGKRMKGALLINQDAIFRMGRLDAGTHVSCEARREHGSYVFVISGRVKIWEEILQSGDAAEITDATKIELDATEESHVLVMEVPM